MVYRSATSPKTLPGAQNPIPTYDVNEYERMHGIYKNPNTLGLLAMQAIFLLLYWWQEKKDSWEGKIILGLIVALRVALLASGSRASLLGLICGFTIFSITAAKLQIKTNLEKFLPALILLVIVGIGF